MKESAMFWEILKKGYIDKLPCGACPPMFWDERDHMCVTSLNFEGTGEDHFDRGEDPLEGS